jgi:adenylate cyclase
MSNRHNYFQTDDMPTQSPDSDIATPEILDALTRVEGSELFANSKRLTELLRFVVEAQLRGDTEGLKQTSIGIELYRRDPSYDPKLDGIVRTHARRLRERLNEYYSSEGAQDPVQISLPRGGYVPVFGRRGVAAGRTRSASNPEAWNGTSVNLDFDLIDAADRPAPRPDSTLDGIYAKLVKLHFKVGHAHVLGVPALVLIPVMVLVITLAGVFTWQRSGGLGKFAANVGHQRLPRVAVLHFRPSGKSAENELFGRALADSIVASLARMNDISVVEPPESSTRPAIDGTDSEIAEQLKADYVVTGRFERTKKLSKLSVTLTEASGAKVIWGRDYSFPWANLVEIEDSMSAALSQNLAQRVKSTN